MKRHGFIIMALFHKKMEKKPTIMLLNGFFLQSFLQGTSGPFIRQHLFSIRNH